MVRTWDVFGWGLGDAMAQRSRIYEENGLVTVKVNAIALGRDDVLRLAQHLLEAAGAPSTEAAMAIGSITFDD